MKRAFAISVSAAFLLAACGGGGKGASPAPSASASAPPVALATVAPASSPIPSPTPESAVYTVKSGDTLSRIAAENKSTVDAIVKANNLTDPDKLKIGQKLTIPGGTVVTASPSASAAGLASPKASSPPPP